MQSSPVNSRLVQPPQGTTAVIDAACSRRAFLTLCAAAGVNAHAVADQPGGAVPNPEPHPAATRHFHLCISPAALEADPELLDTVAAAGVGTIWLPGFFYGHWPNALERLAVCRDRIRRRGLAVQAINIPLGHPGDSLGASDDGFPLTPPPHWKPAQRPDGSTFTGTSLHSPAVQENADAVARLHRAGYSQVFLDDDFRLATGPGVVGGCFCAAHRQRFLTSHGLAPGAWDELRDDVAQRRLTPLARSWIDFTCDELTAGFHTFAAAAPPLTLGLMVMYLGAEKAGIRLADYRGVPLRVGELMFSDAGFAPCKGKTDELFSALFHRRFVAPELAYSETTAFPADALSAENLAAKLAVSLLSDVRHTMFMSGLTPFPRAHWQTLAPAMQRQAALHPLLAGHQPRGPFKHLWGEASRYIGDDRPFSLFLGTGVPFEVTAQPARDGWTFLSDCDARAAASAPQPQPGTTFVARPQAGTALPGGRLIEESLAALFQLKRELLPQLQSVPVVLEDEPFVCGWYPTARRVLLWNLSEQRRQVTLRQHGQTWPVTVDPLGIALSETPA